MIVAQLPCGEVLRSQVLTTLPSVDHFCSMRACADPEAGVWMPRQVHGVTIAVLDEKLLAAPELPEADAVITRLDGQWIGVRTADCVPILVADPVGRVVAAVHAGWRGTVAHILRLTVGQMLDAGCQAANLYAAIGPSIGPEAFEVGEEVADAFCQAGRGQCVVRQLWGPRGRQRLLRPHVDLWQSNVMDLLDCDVPLDHIDCTPWCTFSNPEHFFSARQQGIATGRNVSAICLKC